MKQAEKALTLLLFLAVVWLGGVGSLVTPTVTYAQDYEYLAPLGDVTGTDINLEDVTFGDYLNQLVEILIGLAVLLAVIMVVYGGVQYMTTEATGGKSEAKSTIGRAIGGLILALAGFLILNTINPLLVAQQGIQDVEFEGADLGDLPPSSQPVETDPQEGHYSCYLDTGPLTGDEWMCYYTMSDCQEARDHSSAEPHDDVEKGGCKERLFFNGREKSEPIDYCFIHDPQISESPISLECYSSEGECLSEQDNAEEGGGFWDPDGPSDIIQSCAPPGQLFSHDNPPGENPEDDMNQILQEAVLDKEAAVRSRLFDLGIVTNRGGESDPREGTFCQDVLDYNCTNVGGLADSTISALDGLQAACGNCQVQITGGTEWWLHGGDETDITLNNTTHKPVGYGTGKAVDLAVTEDVSNYIREAGDQDTGCTSYSYPSYRIDGPSAAAGCYYYETNPLHWHVEFD